MNKLYYDELDNNSKKFTRKIVVQVKSGKVGVQDIRKFRGVIDQEKAVIGVFITLKNPTEAMKREAISARYCERYDVKYPRLRILTADDLFDGKDVHRPQSIEVAFIKKIEAHNLNRKKLEDIE